MNERASERLSSGARERTSEQSGASKRVSGANERASGCASGSFLISRFQDFLNHCIWVIEHGEHSRLATIHTGENFDSKTSCNLNIFATLEYDHGVLTNHFIHFHTIESPPRLPSSISRAVLSSGSGINLAPCMAPVVSTSLLSRTSMRRNRTPSSTI